MVRFRDLKGRLHTWNVLRLAKILFFFFKLIRKWTSIMTWLAGERKEALPLLQWQDDFSETRVNFPSFMVGHICVTSWGHQCKLNSAFLTFLVPVPTDPWGLSPLQVKARYVQNKNSLLLQTSLDYCKLTWVELLMGITVIVPMYCRINLKTLTSPEIQNSQLREMVWMAIKAHAIYTH